MPRMTPELLLQHPSYLNPLKDRELDLRGNKIPAIENLGVTKDSLDSIDLTDNAIRSLSNLPRLPRLKHLLLASNPLTTISPSLPTSLPNLTSLILTGTQIEFLSPTLPLLGKLSKLEFLSLSGAPVSKKKWYREWTVHCCKRVRVLDFTKVKMQERTTALSLFFDTATLTPTPLAVTLSTPDPSQTVVSADQSTTFVPGEPINSTGGSGGTGRALTAEEKERVRKAIEDAESVEEVRRLQRMLEQGFVPKTKADAVQPAVPAAAAATPVVEKETEKEVEMEDAEPEPAPAATGKGKGKGKTAAAKGKVAKTATKGKAKATRGSKAREETSTMEVEEGGE